MSTIPNEQAVPATITESTSSPDVAAMEAAIAAEIQGTAPAATPPPAAQAAPVAEAAPAPAPASATPDLADLIASMVKREAADAAARQRDEANRPPPAPQYRSTVSADELMTDPIGALNAAGVPPEHLAQYLVAALAPHAATPEARTRLQMAPELRAITERTTSEITSLRQQVQQMQAQEQARELENSMYTFARGISTEEFPLLGAIAADDQDVAVQELLDVAREDARARFVAGQPPAPLDLKAAAKTVEGRYGAYQKRLAALAAKAAPPAPAPKAGIPAPSAKPAPAATIASMSGAPPSRSAPRTLDEMVAEIEREIFNSPTA